MTYSIRTIGIVVASLIAAGFIITAVLLSGPLPFHLSRANAESTHDLLVSYAAKDTDGDGLPDWEEALYGTDPNNPHSVNVDVTDGQAVAQGLVKPKFATATTTPVDTKSIPGVSAAPTTLTDQFARELFSQYLSQHANGQPTPEEIASFVQQGVTNLQASQVMPDAFTKSQVIVSGSGPDALTAYAVAAEQAFTAHPISEAESELEYLSDATVKNDPAALKKVAEIGKYYTATGKSLMQVPAPKELVTVQLALANSLERLGSVITDLSLLTSDPLKTFVALQEYDSAATGFSRALANMYTVFTAENVSISDGAPGSNFYGILLFASKSTNPAQ